MKDITKKYTNGEVTIVWKPALCIHSANCFNGLGEVFDPKKRPWITTEGAGTERIIEQVKKCPSGALGYYMNSSTGDENVKVEAETIVETTKRIMSRHFADVVRHLISPIAMDRIGKLALKDDKFHFYYFCNAVTKNRSNEVCTNNFYGSCNGSMPTKTRNCVQHIRRIYYNE